MKKILNKILANKKNPIVRNVVVIIGCIVALLALGLVASVIKAMLSWVLALGWHILLTIAITTLLCGVIFGYAEMRTHGYVIEEVDEEEYDDDDDEE